LGFGFGARVLLGDALKGFLPVALAGLWWPDSSAQEAAALGAVLGHLWPVTLRFRGGKGVATAFGAFLALSPEAALWALLVWVLLVAITRKSAVGSLVAALALPLLLWWRGVPSSVWGIALLIAGLIYYKHRENIARLGQGNENSL
jgi:glycerol-3-phosphate acyltransferase PlsY